MNYAVYGKLSYTSEVTTEMEERFARSFRPDDESVCSWPDPDDRSTLMIGFDVDAPDFEIAIGTGRAEILDAAQVACLGGELRQVTAMTDEGYRTWSL